MNVQNLSKKFDTYPQSEVEKILVDAAATEEIEAAVSSLPNIDWTHENLPQETLTILKSATTSPNLAAAITEAKQAYQTTGACVVSFGKNDDLEQTRLKLVTTLSAFGIPFGVFKQKGFWQTLGVNNNAADLRAESRGYIPLHIDFDQARMPPDGVALFCARPDPFGGGESLVFNYEEFLNSMPPEELATFANNQYSYSTLYGQNGVGEVYNPHPLVDIEDGKPTLLRYNGKATPDLSGELSELFMSMEKTFYANSAKAALRAGDLLIVDQTKTLHGRLPLSDREEGVTIPPEQDRLLLQTYLRHEM